MKNKIIFIILFTMVLFSLFLWKEYIININKNSTQSGNVLSWNIVKTGDILSWNDITTHSKIIWNWIEFYTNILSKEFYPKIKINKPIKNIKLIFDITFTDDFKKWNTYNISHWYYFAFKFFLWDLDSFWWFYDVFRNKNDGVSNSINWELTWAQLWYTINNNFTWSISWEKVKVAQPIWTYWYTFIYPESYINSQIWKTIHVWWYLSSVKEMKWRNFTKINQITIEYEGDEDAIEVVK